VRKITESALTVGVLGGMGPLATLDLLHRILELTPAADDRDHIRTLVDNNPKVPSRIDYFLHQCGENPAPLIADMARSLESQGADFLVMPCNTAHLFSAEIAAAVSIPLINMIEVTADRLKSADIVKAGLLASTAVHRTDLYLETLQGRQIESLVPDADNQDRLMAAITDIKAGKTGDEQTNVVQQTADHLSNAGTDALVIACTELSAISSRISTSIPLVDAAQCLAEETVNLALRRKTIE